MEQVIGSCPGHLLHQAVLYDNYQLLQCLLEGEEASYIDTADSFGRTTVHTAVSVNSLQCLMLLLGHGGDPNVKAGEKYQGMTPLHFAVSEGNDEALMILLQYDVDLSILDDSNFTALALAKVIKNTTAVTILDQQCKMQEERLQMLSQCLCRACGEGNVELVKDILSNCGDKRLQALNMIPDYEMPPLCCAALDGSAELVDVLLDNGALSVCQHGTGFSPLYLACQAGHLYAVQYLLKKFPNSVMSRAVLDDQLPLHVAAAQPDSHCLSCLLSHQYPDDIMQTFELPSFGIKYKTGINVNAEDGQGKMPLHIACELGLLENVKLLLQFSVTFDCTGDNISHNACNAIHGRRLSLEGVEVPQMHGDRALQEHCSISLHRVMRSDFPCCSDSVQGQENHVHPVVLNHLSNEGLSPLHYSIINQSTSVFKLLLNNGSDVCLCAITKDYGRLSPLALAMEHHQLSMMHLLLELGVSDPDNKVFHGAFLANDVDTVSLMLQFKSSHDFGKCINIQEWAALTSREKSQPFLVKGIKCDNDVVCKLSVVPVCVNWQGLSILREVTIECLCQASFIWNPVISSMDRSFALCTITKVDISVNSFTQFPGCLLTLPSLVILNASCNLISRLPEVDYEHDMIFCSPALEELNLQNNRLTLLPSYIFHFPVLRFLDVSENKLKELPSDFWLAPSLLTLDLAKNMLIQLPVVSNLAPTSSVSVMGELSTSGDSLPDMYSRLCISHYSRLCVSQSSEAPRDTCCIEDSLCLYKEHVGDGIEYEFPDGSFCESNTLQHVNKWSSFIKVVDSSQPSNVGERSRGIHQLKLSGNQLTTVPSTLPCLAPYLELLDLSDNPLQSVVPICDLPFSLVELNFSNCGINSSQAWQGTSMTPSVNCCGLRQTSSKLSMSKDFLRSEHVTQICCHRNHHNLPHLKKLNLSSNMLDQIVLSRSLDNAVIGNISAGLELEKVHQRLLFPILQELDLSMNNLSSVTPDIGELSDLKVLSLHGNRCLKELPPKLGVLKNLCKLDLEMCPIDGMVQDLLQHSTHPVRDIQGFLLSVLEESTDYMCMNLMLVGSHDIGKTTLLRRLCKEGKVNSMTTHWSDRVSNRAARKQGVTLSTVGIDMNELSVECGDKGTVTFRTWDFAGQCEYYATHQYFLSPRSLYLVVWNVIDGEQGVEGMQQWLVNIQARAPGSSVIIVGTHVDVLRDKSTRRSFPSDFEQAMSEMVNKMFLCSREPDKHGLPSIIASVNVSCKTGENVGHLVDIIKQSVFDIPHPGSKSMKLLGQKIPRKYLLLQTVVRELAVERINQLKDPVLSHSNYILSVGQKLMENGFTTFRDAEELDQATRFLHENGMLFHWDDAALNDLYFLDPQWLCDQLAKVVTVRQINNFAQNGIMKVSSVKFLFGRSSFEPDCIRQYIGSLLAKFELALQFDEEHLLLPSLLPDLSSCGDASDSGITKIPLQRHGSRDDEKRVPRRWKNVELSHLHAKTIVYPRSGTTPKKIRIENSVFYDGSLTEKHSKPLQKFINSVNFPNVTIRRSSNPMFYLCRLYFMTYFPSGFWSHLIVRLLADRSLYDIAKSLFIIPQSLCHEFCVLNTMDSHDPEWHCWKSCLELFFMGFEVIHIREVTPNSTSSTSNCGICNFNQCHFLCSIEQEWQCMDASNHRILEICFPTDALHIQVLGHLGESSGGNDYRVNMEEVITVNRNEKAATQLLVKAVEHVDILLHDWFPELGELRFQQNCHGHYLVTRIVPCPYCLDSAISHQKELRHDRDVWLYINSNNHDISTPVTVLNKAAVGSMVRTVCKKPGAGRHDSHKPNGESSSPLYDGQAYIYQQRPSTFSGQSVVYCYLVERCLLDTMYRVQTVCPVHGVVSPKRMLDNNNVCHTYYIAPDMAFHDLSCEQLISMSDQLEFGSSLGEGTFGKVLQGTLHKNDNSKHAVALKILFEPISHADMFCQGFQVHLEAASTAYLTARQEVSILDSLSHPNIVRFIGLALQPLTLILELAPLGALYTILRSLYQSGSYLPLWVIQQVILQVSRALDYLHGQHIIYRDLKSENVLVWEFPVFGEESVRRSVSVKVADYGISRAVLPTGAKGVGGTPGFTAPEILKHAGRGTYTEKVDIFSLGMLIFELITCHLPFEGVNKPSFLICQGIRPHLTSQEVERSPCGLLDLLAACWMQEAILRPSAAAVIKIVSSTQFLHLWDAVSLASECHILCSASIHNCGQSPGVNLCTPGQKLSGDDVDILQPAQLWLSVSSGSSASIEVYYFCHDSMTIIDSKTLAVSCQRPRLMTAMCAVNRTVWCSDDSGTVDIYGVRHLCLLHQLHLPVERTDVTVQALHWIPAMKQVLALASSDIASAIFTCQFPQHDPLTFELVYSSDVSRTWCSTVVCCGNRWEVWLGQDCGDISVWNVGKSRMAYRLNSHHEIIPSDPLCGFYLVTPFPLCSLSPGDKCHDGFSRSLTSCSGYVWSCTCPGNLILRWDAEQRSVEDRLDCTTCMVDGDLVCQQSSRAIQVTALNFANEHLFIGNSNGEILVINALSLKPVKICHVYPPGESVLHILPVIHMTTHATNAVRKQIYRDSGLISIGRGYADGFSVCVCSTCRGGFSIGHCRHTNSRTMKRDAVFRSMYLLSWCFQDELFHQS